MKHKRSLAKLTFKEVSKPLNREACYRKDHTWWTATQECYPNDWSIRVIFIEDPQPDNTIRGEVAFLMPSAAYLLVPGTKFKLFSAGSGQDWECEIIQELEEFDSSTKQP